MPTIHARRLALLAPLAIGAACCLGGAVANAAPERAELGPAVPMLPIADPDDDPDPDPDLPIAIPDPSDDPDPDPELPLAIPDPSDDDGDPADPADPVDPQGAESVAADRLPATGVDATTLAIAGAALGAAGVVVLAATRRRPA